MHGEDREHSESRARPGIECHPAPAEGVAADVILDLGIVGSSNRSRAFLGKSWLADLKPGAGACIFEAALAAW